MSLNSFHLNKALKLFYLSDKRLVSEIRKEIRLEIKKNKPGNKGGGDFYAPFWSDVKKHIVGSADLKDSCGERILANDTKKNLYPDLRDGFIDWWQNTRKWKNHPVTLIEDSVKNRKLFEHYKTTVKVENLLAIKIDDEHNRYIYPYFYQEGPLSEEAGRLGLWLISDLFQSYDLSEFRILDVFKAKIFSLSDHPLLGNEENIFLSKLAKISEVKNKLLQEYV